MMESFLAENWKHGKFCFRDQITMADCCLVPQVFNAPCRPSLPSSPTRPKPPREAAVGNLQSTELHLTKLKTVFTSGATSPTTGQVLNPGNFGRIISTSNNPRILQFALKFNF